MFPLAIALFASAIQATNVPYPDLTNTRREVVNFNAEPVRPMAQASDGSIYALNSHGSQIVHHTDLNPEPEQIFQTILNPVAIGLWGSDRIVVAGGGTHALALHDRTNGAILDVLPLPSEPADMVIDPLIGAAFVACQGANVVVRVDLATFTINATFSVASQRPRFLSLDNGANLSSASDDVVRVTPFVSGNGSSVAAIPPGAPLLSIVDTYTLQALFGISPLPDDDLFEIAATAPSGDHAATPVAQRIGTLLTAHGRHPNGAYWALNVDARNQDPLLQSEPKLRGDFAKNRVWIGDLIAGSSNQVDLDSAGGTAPYSAATAVAFPFGLAFEPTGATRAFVTSPLDDCVSIRQGASGGPVPVGELLGRLDLPAGSIPLDVEVDSVFDAFLFVYCWGTNQIRVYSLANPTAGLFWKLDLGVDPTPDPIKRGREIWYDGHRSKNARSSCNTCHPGGKSDFLGWQISDDPSDRKDVMVTQSLLGIEDTFPYHWRGERALIDFNGAFVDLLGGASKLTEGPGSEFDDFQAFVFSLQPHANPREILERELPPTIEPVEIGPNNAVEKGNVQNGLQLFTTRLGFNSQTCASCHIPQSGSNGDTFNEVPTDLPSMKTVEVAHLRELTHKDGPVFNLTLGGVPIASVGRGGFGTAHAGLAPNIGNFVRLGAGGFNLNTKEAADVAAFVRRFDQGIAPAAHFALMLDATHLANAAIIDGLLRQQAGLVNNPNRWIDVVAFGRVQHPTAGPRLVRFYYEAPTFSPVPPPMEFVCSDTTVSPTGRMTLAALQAQAQLGQAELVFLGLPPSSGRRFALDPDNDALSDAEEVTWGTDPFDPDSDDDEQPDGYEVANSGGDPMDPQIKATDSTHPTANGGITFSNASLAKLEVRGASEPVQVVANFGVTGVPSSQKTASTPVFARDHTLVLQGLDPSTPSTAPLGAHVNQITGTVDLIDRAGLVTSFNISFAAKDMLYPVVNGIPLKDHEAPVVVSSLAGSKTSSGGSMSLQLSAQLKQRFFDPAGTNATAVTDRVVVFQVLRELSAGANLYEIVPITDFSSVTGQSVANLTNHATNAPISAITGPLLLAPATTSTSLGLSTVDVTVIGLAVGQKVRVRVIAIVHAMAPNGVIHADSLNLFQFPATSIDDRGLEFAY